jgi:hypothetical protein
MKAQTLSVLAAILLTLSACTKTSSSSSSTPMLNSTETQLTGTWYLSSAKVTGLLDTTFTGYNNSCYIQFTTSHFSSSAPDNYKLAQQAFGAVPGPSFPSASPEYWYYDPSVSKLVISPVQYSITTLSATQLIIVTSSSAQTNTYSFHK